ncbi:MAG: hypothetical protein M3N59_01275, partial [bacterium]|nr:hypothetical protein [bacterium]
MIAVLVLLVIASAAVVGCGSDDDDSGPVITGIDVKGSNDPPKRIKHRDPETVRGIVDNCRVT